MAESLTCQAHVNSDFQKVFVSLWYVLLHKFLFFGVNDSLLALLQSYSVGLKLFIMVATIPTASFHRVQTLDLCFSLVLSVIHTPKLIFADDMKIYYCGSNWTFCTNTNSLSVNFSKSKATRLMVYLIGVVWTTLFFNGHMLWYEGNSQNIGISYTEH